MAPKFRPERMVKNYKFIRRVNFPLQTASNFQLSLLKDCFFNLDLTKKKRLRKSKIPMFNFNRGTLTEDYCTVLRI
jgi:hypothetical protein